MRDMRFSVTVGQIAFTHGALLAAGAAAMAVPIAIHLLARLQRRPVAWGAMRFLAQAYRRHRHRLRLEQWALLTVRCLILIVLGLALSGPWLTGCQGVLGLTRRPRVVCLVIDDSLASQARNSPGSPASPRQTRFDALKRQAMQILDQLRPTDRVGIWSAARPAREVLSPEVGAVESAKRALQSLQPRLSRGDLNHVLTRVEARLSRRVSPADQIFLVLVSPLAQGAVSVDDKALPPPEPPELTEPPEPPETPELEHLGQRAHLLVERPAPAVTNVQIAGFSPLRRTLVAAGPWDAIPVELRLRRFNDEAPDRETTVEMRLYHPSQPAPLAAARKEYRWLQGQNEVAFQMDIPLPRQPIDAATPSEKPVPSATALWLEARLVESNNDALSADDTRWTFIELKNHLAVGLIGGVGGGLGSGTSSLAPADWLALALTVGGEDRYSQNPNLGSPTTSGIQTVTLDPHQIDPTRIASLDAVMIVGPDLLAPPAWAALRQWVEQGGTAWFFAPASSDQSWTSRLREHFGLDFQVGLEPQEKDADHAWTLAADRGAPALLNMLAADWSALIRPIRVLKRLPLVGTQPSDEIWLATHDGQPLLVSNQVGQGRVLVLAAAVDPLWTNLPTKPLFVPLLQETLRAAVANRPSGLQLPDVLCGDQPALTSQWRSADPLVNQTTRSTQPAALKIDESPDRLALAGPVEQPGIYASAHPAQGPLLVANPDPQGGDTRPLTQEQLTRWLRWAPRRDWLDVAHFQQQITAQASHGHLGWPLLWAVLGLVLAETFLARWFSHVGGSGRSAKSWTHRLVHLIQNPLGAGS